MKRVSSILFAIAVCAASVAAQVTVRPVPSPTVRPRVIVVGQPTTQVSPTPTNNPRVVIVPNAPQGFPSASPRPIQTTPTPAPQVSPTVPPKTIIVVPTPVPYNPPAQTTLVSPYAFYSLGRNALTLGQIKARVAEAKRFLQSRPVNTALTDERGMLMNDGVTIAALDPRTNQIETITLPKTTFLTLYLETPTVTASGKPVRVRTLRANGVNTAVVIYDQNNQLLAPLVVQYPVERNGRFYEMAYYSSAHPSLLSPEIARAGQLYVRTVLETAIKNLRSRGVFVSPAVAAEAEKLCIVEHIDHQRFLTENRVELYSEVFTLFALNEGGTYRYAVSTAGAGGLVQMIPATYRMVQNAHPNVPLKYDFVEGMRDHQNAMQAMLLYMQDTYGDLLANQTITQALSDGTATDAELMAAGYNSNPAKLASYIKRGGANWRYLIPRETQMYLQIQASIEQTVKPLTPVK